MTLESVEKGRVKHILVVKYPKEALEICGGCVHDEAGAGAGAEVAGGVPVAEEPELRGGCTSQTWG
jgi:hypothetical protein